MKTNTPRYPLLLALSLAAAAPAFAEGAAELWEAQCRNCHGADGVGKTKIGLKEKIEDISTAKWQEKHTDAQIRSVIEDGSKKNKKMKSFKEKLSPEEIDSLVAYVRTLKK